MNALIDPLLIQQAAADLDDRGKRLLNRAVGTLEHGLLQSDGERSYPWGTLRGIAPSAEVYRGLWNWDSCFHALALARFDPTLAREQLQFFLGAQRPDGCFPDCIEENGAFCDGWSKPPVIFFTCEQIDRLSPDDAWLREVYPKLVRCAGFWEEKRSEGGLFHYGFDNSDEPDVAAKWESGWDNSPRFDGDIAEDIFEIDLNCYMVLAYRALSYMAVRLGITEDAGLWQAKEKTLSRLVEERLWSEKLGAYCDLYRDGRGDTGVLSPASFMPLFAGIASDEHAKKLALLAEDPAYFHPLFPSVAYSHPSYTEDKYWRGPLWLNIAFMAIEGLRRNGFVTLADGFTDRILELCDREDSSIYEYYDSRTGKGLGATNYGWSAAFLILAVLGVRVLA